MRLIFVRHGHTNFNRWGIMNDDPSINVKLTGLGKKQARSAAEQLKDVSIDQIYASMLPRTLETAEIINKYHKLEIHRDARINDNRTGYNGFPHFIRLITFFFAKDKYRKRFRDGESLDDSRERVFEFIEDIRKKHADETVLVVGHANTGWIIKGYVNRTPLEKMFSGKIVNGFPAKYDL
jgi:broad specificity phosphatase PhoE